MTHPFPAVIMKGNFKIREETHGITFLTPSNHIGRLQGTWWGISRLVLSDFVTPWTAAHQAPLSMEFSRQEYWRGLPFPSPGDLPDPGIESPSPALQAEILYRFLFSKVLGKSKDPGAFSKPQSSAATFRTFVVAACSAAAVYFIKT